MTPHVLILGATGMLGHMVEHVLASAGCNVRGITRAELDAEHVIAPSVIARSESANDAAISRGVSLAKMLDGADYVINCIGITVRHINDADPASIARAIRVNAAFPHALAAAAAECGAKVIHMSTDGVFSGTGSSPSRWEGELEGVGIPPYSESDPPDATDTYGRTKILGESSAPNVLNIRCSILGPSPQKREGFWEWVASQPDGATVQGFTNHIWHGATTRQLAELCVRIIASDPPPHLGGGRLVLRSPKGEAGGGVSFDGLRADGHVLHFAPNTPCTKYKLVCAIRDALGKRLTIEPVAHAQPIARVLATRSAALRDLLGPARPIAEAVRACAALVRTP